MSKFKITKKLDLDRFGKGSYLSFSLVTYKESEEISEIDIKLDDPKEAKKSAKIGLDLLKSKFIEGKLPDINDKLVEVLSEDFADLPIEIISEAISFLGKKSVEKSENQ